MDDQTKQYDVTTPDARKRSLERIARVQVIGALFPVVGPLWSLYVALSEKSAQSTSKEIETQRKTAVEIIRAGKENNVDELEITMSEQAGIGLGSTIEGFPTPV